MKTLQNSKLNLQIKVVNLNLNRDKRLDKRRLGKRTAESE